MTTPGPAARARTAALVLALLVQATAAAAQVPRPADVLGFEPGTDFRLARYEPIERYFRALDRASDRIVVEEIGRSVRGRPMLLAVISSEANVRDRERYRDIARRLALAKDLTDEQARALAREGKAVVWIDGGLHATEVAHGQYMPELAHHLVTDESEETRRIRENVITLVMPNMNPDGLDIVVDWYEPNVGTPFETAVVPELYHHYIGHDNNRDWYMFTQPETRAVARQLYHVWFPQVVYNHHQSSPFPGRIWTPPFENPVNPNLDPLVVTSLNQIGETMKKRFDLEGKPGANSGIVFDLWWNGSMRGGPDFHNMLGFLTETALHRYATPRCYRADEIPETFGPRARNLPAKTPTTEYPNPWLGGCWHLRDAMDYMHTASLAVLDLASRLREDYLFNIYWMGRRQTERGGRAEGGPFAYVVDLGAQHDAPTAVELLRLLREAGIEIRRADRPFAAGGREYAAGAYVIPPQAFRPYVVDLMEPKRFPERLQYPGGPPQPPYDMTGYELRFQMGVAVDPVTEPFPMPGPELDQVPPAPGGVTGTGTWGHLLSPASNASVKAMNRLLAAGARAARATAGFEAGGRQWPAGTWLVEGAPNDRVAELASELGLEFHRTGRVGVPSAAVRAPRVGLYRSHVASMPEGWTRWLLEEYGFTFENLYDADVRAGDLGRFDVIVLPDQEAASILDGHEAGSMPERYVGGLGASGVAALRRFVEAGGWLVAFDAAVDFPIRQFGLPVRNATTGLGTQEFFIPGSLIRVDLDPEDALAWGMPREAVAMFARSQVLETVAAAGAGSGASDDVAVYGRYAARDFLVSGWTMGGERHLAGRPAAVRTPLGAGQVVLLAFTPHFRGQPRNTYKLLFNPLLASAMQDGGRGPVP
jgi:hypothetical protein